MKIKEMFSRISTNFKDLIKKYPITLFLIIITTFIVTFAEYNTTIMKIVLFTVIWGFGTFFTETFFKDRVNKIIALIVSGIISYIFIRMGYFEGEIFGIKDIVLHEILFKVLVCYLTSLFILTIYELLKQSELTFSKFILNIFANVFTTSIIYGVLAIGILLLSLIFINLILNNFYSLDIISKTQLLLLGLFYVPAIMYCITNTKNKEISNIIKKLVYVLLALVSIAIVIIYIYIIKIIIQQNMPSNFIYRIIAGIFVFTFPTLIIASNYTEENKIIKKVTKILPYAFIPLLILEIYSIVVRTIDYGLTPNRYLCFAFALLQIIAIALWIYKKQEKINHIFAYIITITIIATISPFNLQHISAISQRNILLNNFKQGTNYDSLDVKTKAKVRGAYQYINGLTEADKYMPDYLKNDKDIEEKLNYRSSFTNRRSIYYYDNESEITVTGYDTLNKLYITGTKDKLEIDNSNIRNRLDVTNINNYIDQVLEQEQGRENEFISNNKYIEINENQKILITNLSIYIFSENQEMSNLTLQGYLLTKE